MKIKEIVLKNFAAVSDIKVNVSPEITYLVGENGAGKTTVGLNGIWFILKGLAQKGPDVFHAERFRFIGPVGKSATGELTLHDETENIDITVTRKLTKTATTLEVVASDGRKLDQDYLDNIFNIFTINLFSFSKLSAKEQALALGLDTSEFDQIKGELYKKRRDVAREVKRLETVKKACGKPDKVEPVDIGLLLGKKDRIDKENIQAERDVNAVNAAHVAEINEFNQEQKNISKERVSIIQQQESIAEEQKRLQIELDVLEKKLKDIPNAQPRKTPDPPKQPELVSTEALTKQIANAENINRQAREYQNYTRVDKEYRDEAAKLEDIETQYAKNEADRTKHIQSKNLPFSNMNIDVDGGLLINEKPFCEPYFSKGEIMRMSAKLATISASDTKLKYIFIPDAQSIDEKNREKLFGELVNLGYQIMAELVDNKACGDNSILLSEGQVVEVEKTQNNFKL